MRLARPASVIVIVLCLMSVSALAEEAYQVLQFEAEDISRPESAWQVNRDSEDHWNLWSTDQDAEKKWSEGVVLRSPTVEADRDAPEDGAPPLHSVVTELSPGRYSVYIGGVGRPMGVSLDGETWQKQTGHELGEFDIEDGHFELWVDDRYAAGADSTGPTYYDYLRFTPVVPDEHGVRNGAFEAVMEGGIAGWAWWCRESGAGTCTLTDAVAHGGRRSALIEHDGERDFALSNRGRLAVQPGDKLTVSAWVRAESADNLTLALVGMRGGEVVRWYVARNAIAGPCDWTLLQAAGRVTRNIDEVYVRFTGRGRVRAWVDDVTLQEGWPRREAARKPPTDGWAERRVAEAMGRGLVAVPIEGGRVYLSWRLLRDDPDGVAFEVYRRAGAEGLRKLGDAPITGTCDFIDESPVPGVENRYAVKPVRDGWEGETSRPAGATPSHEARPYISIPLQGDYEFQKAGIADLNGDGAFDFVIKQPNANVDPYEEYWYPSPDTYKLEAYLSDGTFLWRRDLGWGIERGIWYSPYIVHDLDGDGRAEVAVKTGPEGDPRDEDGRVITGPEYLSILDGMTGEELDRVDWPSREGFAGYNVASRNLICVAYLDGRTPCVVVDRGTYGTMKVVAYQFHDGRLEQLWSWRDSEEAGMYAGQGAHSMHAADVDGDGRDEVFLGSAVLDDNGVGLWSSGMGHPDHHYVGEIDPTRPGLEVYYGMETAASADGCWLADAETGQWLWGLDEPTRHVHASGLCADIDPRFPGCECYSGERDFPEKRWLWSARGELIQMGDVGGLSPRTAFWDDDLQRELVRGSRIESWQGETHTEGIEGRLVGVADILGDWREELIVTLPGELRIYTTTIPARDRRVCLMQDHIYRMDVAIQAMGYTQMPMLSYCPSAGEANLSIVIPSGRARVGEKSMAELVVTAPAERGLEGTVRLRAGEGVALGRSSIDVRVPPGEIGRYAFGVTLQDAGRPAFAREAVRVSATYEGAGGLMEAAAEVASLDEPLTGLSRVQAEEIADQGGGAVQIRDDKVAADGLCFSHWDDAGHWVEWALPVAADGRYLLAVRYCSQESVRRSVSLDGEELGEFSFPSTGGFSSEANDWAHEVLKSDDGRPLVFDLRAGEHLLRMSNADGNGMNLDYVALIPAS
ncbi:MAG: carbohydrate binding domain-containing protein [Armatimonadota bacterium]